MKVSELAMGAMTFGEISGDRAGGRPRPEPFAAVQLRYNLLERIPEHELLPMAASFGLPVFAWGPLAEGA